MVLKTGPDQPVRLPDGHDSSPVRQIGPKSDRTGIGPDEPVVRQANRTNQPVPSEPSGSTFFFFFPPSICAAVPIVAGHWSVIPLAAAPTRWKALP